MEIVLIRHGKPKFELEGKVRSRNFGEIVRSYNLSGISDEPSDEAKKQVLSCKVVICSDLNRSLESAQALGIGDIHLSDPMFREVAMPHFKTGSVKLSIGLWVVIYRIMSVFGFSNNGESLVMAKKRAIIAASTLIEIAQTHKRTLLVGHGFINYFIAKELLSRSWSGPSKPGRNYWEYGIYKNKSP